MQTALIILAVTILVITVDFAFEIVRSRLKNSGAHRLLFDSLARFSEKLQGITILPKLSSSKLLSRLKMLTEESCPYCSSTHMRRSHRYFFEKPLSIFSLWPYRGLHCKARFLKMPGRHFDNARHPTRGET